MPKGIVSHAVERAPQVELASLSQLKELVAMMDARNPRLTKPYMQDFLRFRFLTPPKVEEPKAVTVDPFENECKTALGQAEGYCRKYYPDIVNEVLELFVPWCDPKLDLEFKPIGKCEEDHAEKVLEAFFWVNTTYDQVRYHHLNRSLGRNDLHDDPHNTIKRDSKTLREDIGANVHNKEYQTRCHLDASFGRDAAYIVQHTCIDELLTKRFKATGAYKYGLIQKDEIKTIIEGIWCALAHSIAFLSVGDKERGNVLKPFLKLQRSGTPVIYRKDDWIHVLCL